MIILLVIAFSMWALYYLENEVDFYQKKNVFSIKVYFNAAGNVNEQKYSIWSSVNTYVDLENLMHLKIATI